MSAVSVAPAEWDGPVASAPHARDDAVPGPSLGDLLRSHSIVVAVGGEPDGGSAARIAAALARRYGSQVSAIQVRDVSDLPLFTPLPDAVTFAREPFPQVAYADDARTIRRHLSEWLGQSNAWPIHITTGAAPYEIARYAERQVAALIVLGLRRHGVIDHVVRDEATLTVARRARGAVLAATPGLCRLPHRALVGVDFGPASLRAARAALDIVAPPSPSDPVHVRLVYVDGGDGVAGHHDDTEGGALIRRLGVATAFDQLVRDLAAPPGVIVDCVTRHGAVAAELLACADDARADLITIASRRHELRDRQIAGTVMTEVIRDGRCSVLVVPPSHDL